MVCVFLWSYYISRFSICQYISLNSLFFNIQNFWYGFRPRQQCRFPTFSNIIFFWYCANFPTFSKIKIFCQSDSIFPSFFKIDFFWYHRANFLDFSKHKFSGMLISIFLYFSKCNFSGIGSAEGSDSVRLIFPRLSSSVVPSVVFFVLVWV